MKKAADVMEVAVIVVVVVLVLLGSGAHADAPALPNDAKCMSAAKWSANDARRPCAEVARVYEDGSVKLLVLDANGTVRYDVAVGVPNGYERSR